MTLPVVLTGGAKPPRRAHPGDAGLDLTIARSVVIKPGRMVVCGTGVQAAIPEGHAGLVMARSSLYERRGLILANGVAVIDATYRGEIKLPLLNVSGKAALVMAGQRLAQLVIVPIVLAEPVEAKALGETERGAAGFGSTGV